MNRTCKKCSETKELTIGFYKNSSNRGGGYNYQCKECCKAYCRLNMRGHNYYRSGGSRGRFYSYKGEAKRKSLVFEVSFDFFDTIISKDCFYCGISSDKEMIGVDRINNSIGYTISNCVPCCSKCNYSKRDRTSESFIEHCNRVVNHQNQLTNTLLMQEVS